MWSNTQQGLIVPPAAGDSVDTGSSTNMPMILEGAFHRSERNDTPQEIQSWGIILNSQKRAAAPVFIRGGCTAWIDDDDSGNYDPVPNHEKPKRRSRINSQIVKRTSNARSLNGMGPGRHDHRLLQESIEALRMNDKEDSRGRIKICGNIGSDNKGQLALRTKWCSICPAPAFYQCCTKQQFNKFGEPTTSANNGNINGNSDNSPENTGGCGLLLCEVCEDLVFEIAEVFKATRMDKTIIDGTVLS